MRARRRRRRGREGGTSVVQVLLFSTAKLNSEKRRLAFRHKLYDSLHVAVYYAFQQLYLPFALFFLKASAKSLQSRKQPFVMSQEDLFRIASCFFF